MIGGSAVNVHILKLRKGFLIGWDWRFKSVNTGGSVACNDGCGDTESVAHASIDTEGVSGVAAVGRASRMVRAIPKGPSILESFFDGWWDCESSDMGGAPVTP